MKKIKISPSILAADRGRLGEQIATAEKGGADMIHIDFMDFVFVPNIGVGLTEMKEVKKHTSLPLDVHLMCRNPVKYAKDFIVAGADRITFHFEAFDDPNGPLETINEIRNISSEWKVKVGIALNPNINIVDIVKLLPDLDFVLIMSVWPGKAGQKYIEGSENKVKELRSIRDRDKLDLEIEVDGGVGVENARKLAGAGADILVAGSSIFGQENIEKATKALKNL